MTNTKTVLENARALVANGWTQGAFARTESGLICDDVMHDRATSFCILGAIERSAQNWFEDTSARKIMRKATDERITLGCWNDAPERTQAEVLAAFDRAIELT